MSDIAVKLTFKIDKFSGEVFQLVQQKDEIVTWELIKKEKSSKTFKKKMLSTIRYFQAG